MTAQALEGVPAWLWERATAGRRLLVLDYDGTLAPFAVVRADASVGPGTLRLLERIADSPSTLLAVVSGRPIRELRQFLGTLPAWLVGEHGWERESPRGLLFRHPVPKKSRAALERGADAAVRSGWGGHLEIRRAAIAIHTRGMPQPQASELEEACAEAWKEPASASGLRLASFDGGVEMRDASVNKGTAVFDLMMRATPGALPVYLGDDQSDEDAFAVVRQGGLGIRVGTRERPTLARGWLESPDEVASFLERWLRVVEERPLSEARSS